MGPQAHQQVFQQLISQARQFGLVKDRLRLRLDPRPGQYRGSLDFDPGGPSRHQLLEAALPYAAERVEQEQAEVIRLRSGTVDLPYAERFAHRVAHLRNLVAWPPELLPPGEPAVPEFGSAPQRLRQALNLAHKVLHDPDNPKAPDKVVSVHDPEARTGWHHQWFTGYSLDIAMDADSELITAVDVLAANADEAANATRLIYQEEQSHGNDVKAMSIDGIGFRGDLIDEWTDPNRLNLEVIVPPTEPTPSAGFSPEAFTLDSAQAELTCPAGQTTTTRQRNANYTGWKYRFAPRQCAECPLRRQCMAKPETTTGGRTVIKNDYEATYRSAREQAKTPGGVKAYVASCSDRADSSISITPSRLALGEHPVDHFGVVVNAVPAIVADAAIFGDPWRCPFVLECLDHGPHVEHGLVAVGVAAERPDRQRLELGGVARSCRRRRSARRRRTVRDGPRPGPSFRGRPWTGRSRSRGGGRRRSWSSRRRGPQVRRCCRPSRRPRFRRAWGKTTRAGTPWGRLKIAGPIPACAGVIPS